MEIKIDEQFSVFIEKYDDLVLMELHDFDNLCFYRGKATLIDLNIAIDNPSSFFNYFELT